MINVDYLKNASNLQRFERGSIIIYDGDSQTNGMYIILQGQVGVYKNYGQDDEIDLATIRPGGFFGEMSLFLNKERSATVVAKEDVVVLEISRMNAYDFFEKQPRAVYSLIRTLCIRIDELNMRLMSKNEHEHERDENAAIVEQVPEYEFKKNQRLFPDAHKKYSLELKEPDEGLLTERTYQCPICLQIFKKKTVKLAELKRESTDRDLRPHYKGIDTLYYEVITCPSCFLSAFAVRFEKALTKQERHLHELLAPHKLHYEFYGSVPNNVNDVFASLYLALISAPLCYPSAMLVSGKVWQRISWLYHDCGDVEMEAYATRQAFHSYIRDTKNAGATPERTQRVDLIIGELALKIGELEAATEYFFQAKIAKVATAAYTRQADARLDEIKRMLS